MWIIHGTADRDVSVACSDAVVNAMKKFEDGTKRLHYDRIKGMNHSDLARVFYMDQAYEWLFSHSLTDENREIKPTFEVSKSTLARKKVYSGLRSKSQSKLMRKDNTNK